MALITFGLQWAWSLPIYGLFTLPDMAVDSIAIDIGIGVGSGLAVVVLWRLCAQGFAWAQQMESEFRAVLGPLTSSEILALAFMSAFVEELFFRGFLQPQIGLEWAAIAFGLVHLPYRRQLIPWTLSAVAMGFAFGWMYEARGLLLAPFLAHFVINYFNLHTIVRPRAT